MCTFSSSVHSIDVWFGWECNSLDQIFIKGFNVVGLENPIWIATSVFFCPHKSQSNNNILNIPKKWNLNQNLLPYDQEY